MTNSYIQIELNGKLMGLKFNQLAWEEFVKILPTDDKNKFDWVQSNSLSAYACIYAGLCGNAIVKREVVDFSFEDVSEWVDEAITEDIKKAWQMFAETQQYKDMLDKFSEKIRSLSIDEDKKKVTRKKLKAA